MKPLVIIAAGGTGGHVFPALAVCEVLQNKYDILWIGRANSFESRTVTRAGLAFYPVAGQGLRGRSLVARAKAIAQAVQALFQVCTLFFKRRPAVVLGMGGYVSGPASVAAKLFLVPLMIHEQNAVAGKTNRLLAKLANIIAESFPGTFDNMPRVRYVGNPVRANIRALSGREIRPISGRLRVLLVGGSQGARWLNEKMPEVVAGLSQDIEIWHQCGAGNLTAIDANYRERDFVRVTEFIDNMSDALQWADVAICRAGATTVAELAVVALPAILVPYPYAVDDHQTLNASSLADAGAVLLAAESDQWVEQVSTALTGLSVQRELLLMMKQSYASMAHLDAHEQIAHLVAELAGECHAS